MKDLYFFFLKNLMGVKIKRSFRSTCHDDNSTSTLDQQHSKPHQKESSSFAPSQVPSSSSYMGSEFNNAGPNVLPRKSVTLEEMILQLELEEEKAKIEKAAVKCRQKDEDRDEFRHDIPRRMSCVNNSDILRSARNALNQYPRFSLDGRDAMYRSSFHNNNVGRAIDGLKLGRILHLPQSVGGESVIWCKPGVVPKLMGLEAMPLPISRLYNNNSKNKNKQSKENLCNVIRSQNFRRRVERNEIERKQRKIVIDSKVNCRNNRKSDCGVSVGAGAGAGASGSSRGGRDGSCSNKIGVDNVYGLGGQLRWPTPYNCT
ncbi:hypothetical protein RND81_05G206000 [Saponaria officinalis]|uniref:DUF3741 domain-containing protein n=1 Tax=Saponaria officinalis TaxID=3572 RepID=A0AAW1L1K7_SAPOF